MLDPAVLDHPRTRALSTGSKTKAAAINTLTWARPFDIEKVRACVRVCIVQRAGAGWSLSGYYFLNRFWFHPHLPEIALHIPRPRFFDEISKPLAFLSRICYSTRQTKATQFEHTIHRFLAVPHLPSPAFLLRPRALAVHLYSTAFERYILRK